MKPSSSYFLLNFVYITVQWHHSLEVHSLQRKIRDSDLIILRCTSSQQKSWIRPWISLPDALNFYISPDTKVLSHFVPLLVSSCPEHLVNSCVMCSPVATVAQMVQIGSNSILSLVLINHRDISVISKRGYLTRPYTQRNFVPVQQRMLSPNSRNDHGSENGSCFRAEIEKTNA